jgi:hypothetical protein
LSFVLLSKAALSAALLGADVNPGKGLKETKDIQDPQNHGNHNNAIQDGLDGPLHRDEAIHQPQEDTHHNEHFHNLN